MEIVSSQLTVLGHPQRLKLFRLLMRRYPDHVTATELAVSLGLKPSTFSNHISALMRAGVVTQERRGTSLRYAIEMSAVRTMLDYLIRDCCLGRPDLCRPFPMPISEEARPVADKRYSVLFICTGNSARSIFAESILNREGQGRFDVYSAGTRPNSELNPFALEVLNDKGYDTSVLRSKNISEMQTADAPDFDFVFTVCDQAANEECPAWQGQPISAHWGMPDPVKVQGTDAHKSLAFQQAYGALRHRLLAFSALPFDSLDRISLQKAVDDIGREAVDA
mgnify:CR=1 FL=1